MAQDRENKVQKFPDRPPLGYAEYGDPEGRPVLAFHGTPGSRFKFRSADAPARQTGIRVIALDRRSYGLSPFGKAEPSLANWAEDIRAFADALLVPQFGVMGVSGGGPFAAAIAALLGDRVTALALVSPVGPLDDPKVRDEMSLFHRICFLQLPKYKTLFKLPWHALRIGLHSAPNTTLRLAFIRGPLADKSTLKEKQFRLELGQTFQEGLRTGVAGPISDAQIFSQPWGLPLGKITAPSCIWIGSKDENVPLAATRHLAEIIPFCSLDLIPEAGHLWISRHSQEVLAWIARIKP